MSKRSPSRSHAARDVITSDTLNAVFSALAHSARRQILISLHARGGVMTAGEIADDEPGKPCTTSTPCPSTGAFPDEWTKTSSPSNLMYLPPETQSFTVFGTGYLPSAITFVTKKSTELTTIRALRNPLAVLIRSSS